MTAKTSNGNGSLEKVESQLYNETVNVTPENVSATNVHARSIAEAVAEKIFDKAKDIGKDVMKGYARTTYSLPAISDGYVSTTTLHRKYIKSQPADENWLKDVTGKNEYVFGATVFDGDFEGTYIDENVVEGAERYFVSYSSGKEDDAAVYSPYAVEGLATEKHEEAHYMHGIVDEKAAERYAVESVRKIAETDSAIRFALENYAIAA